MKFQIDDLVVMKNIEDKSKSIWRVKAVFTEAIDVVPLKNGNEIKMLQGVYGTVRFRKAQNYEIQSGHRDLGFSRTAY